MGKLKAVIAFGAALLSIPAWAQQPPIPISQLPSAGAPTSSDLFYVVQGGISKSVTFAGFTQSLLSANNSWTGLNTFTQPISTPSLPGLSASVQGTGIPGLDGAQWFIYQNVTVPPAGQFYTFRSQRDSNYSGGSGTFGAVWAACNPSNAGESDFVYCSLSTISSSEAGTGTVVASYSQTFKNATGSSWASVMELRDNSTNPTAASVTQEIDLFAANASDSAGNRIAQDMDCGLIPGTTGYTPLCTDMIRIGAQNEVVGNGAILRGISFTRATWTGALIGSELGPTAVNGIDFTGITFSGLALDLNGFTVNNTGATAIGAGAAITSSGPGGVLGNPAFVASSVSKTCGGTIVVANGVVTSC